MINPVSKGVSENGKHAHGDGRDADHASRAAILLLVPFRTNVRDTTTVCQGERGVRKTTMHRDVQTYKFLPVAGHASCTDNTLEKPLRLEVTPLKGLSH